MAMILVLDDNADTCDAIKQGLLHRGHVVHTGQSVERGVEMLKRCQSRDWPHPEKYAVAIIDMRFDNFEGGDMEAAGMHVIEAAVQVPFLEPIVLTAYPSIESAAQAVEKGVFRYVMKVEAARGKQQFMERLLVAVDLAVEYRQVMLTLNESVRMLRECFEGMKSHGLHGRLLDEARNYLDWAKKAHEIIWRSRGRKLEV